MPICAIVSFRLGLTDGVSIVAAHWATILADLGFEVRTVAGEGPVDALVPGLEIGAGAPPSRADLERALADVDLVVVENVLTIPLNLAASRLVHEVVEGRPAILHHHDPPWQRARFAHVTELPPDDPAWSHVTINELTRRELAQRGITATAIHNGFDPDPGPGDRAGLRAELRVTPGELLVAHPVRAIGRKGIPAAIRLCEELGATYWLLGAAEESYGGELDRLLTGAACPVIHRPWRHVPDIYAAADFVAFPSTWEGFGNPPIEASLHRRGVAVGPYPVGHELRALGFRWFDATDAPAIGRFLEHPDAELLDHNRRVAVRHFSLEVVASRLRTLLADRGWLP